MTPPQDQSRTQTRPRAASPAERSVEFAATQERLKQEAAARRLEASKREETPAPRRGPRRSG